MEYNQFATIIYFIFIFFTSIGVHEFGHLLYFERKGIKAEVRFFWESWRYFGYRTGNTEQHEQLTYKEKYYLSLSGIAAGLLFICGATILFMYWQTLLLIIPYLYGCRRDIMNMINSYKGVDAP